MALLLYLSHSRISVRWPVMAVAVIRGLNCRLLRRKNVVYGDCQIRKNARCHRFPRPVLAYHGDLVQRKADHLNAMRLRPDDPNFPNVNRSVISDLRGQHRRLV